MAISNNTKILSGGRKITAKSSEMSKWLKLILDALNNLNARLQS